MRLDKLLTHLAICSRAGSREILKAGRVKMNGKLCRSGAENVPEGAEILLDGKPLDTRLSRCLMLYKPAGVLTAKEDNRQKTIMDLLPPLYTALGCMPVGRLDKDTTGILILTTDGVLAHRLLAPERHVNKIYEAKVEGVLEAADQAAFAEGLPLKDFTALPASLEIIAPDVGRLTVQEGKYHQVKRMFGARGKPVLSLHRLSFGPLQLDEALSPGDYRELTKEEEAALYEAAAMNHE